MLVYQRVHHRKSSEFVGIPPLSWRKSPRAPWISHPSQWAKLLEKHWTWVNVNLDTSKSFRSPHKVDYIGNNPQFLLVSHFRISFYPHSHGLPTGHWEASSWSKIFHVFVYTLSLVDKWSAWLVKSPMFIDSNPKENAEYGEIRKIMVLHLSRTISWLYCWFMV